MIVRGQFYEAAAALTGLAILWMIVQFTKRLFPGHLLPWLQSVVILIFFEAVFLGTILDFNDTLRNFDKINHSISGTLLALIGLILFYWLNPDQRTRLTVKPDFIALFCIGFAMTVKVLWEFYEYLGDRILNANMQRWQFGVIYALTDTMLDLAVGMAGSLIVSLVIRHQLRLNSERFYQNFIRGFFVSAKKK